MTGTASSGQTPACRHAARGALVIESLSALDDGRVVYRMKRPLPDGTQTLVFTGLDLLRCLAALVPPSRVPLLHFHGVFAP